MFSKRIEKIKAERKKVEGEEENKGEDNKTNICFLCNYIAVTKRSA